MLPQSAPEVARRRCRVTLILADELVKFKSNFLRDRRRIAKSHRVRRTEGRENVPRWVPLLPSHLFLPRLPFLFILNTRWSVRHPRWITVVCIQLWQVKCTLWLLGLMNSTIVSHIYFFKTSKTLVLLRKIDLMRRNCSGAKKIKWRTVILKHRRLIMKIWFIEGNWNCQRLRDAIFKSQYDIGTIRWYCDIYFDFLLRLSHLSNIEKPHQTEYLGPSSGLKCLLIWLLSYTKIIILYLQFLEIHSIKKDFEFLNQYNIATQNFGILCFYRFYRQILNTRIKGIVHQKMIFHPRHPDSQNDTIR